MLGRWKCESEHVSRIKFLFFADCGHHIPFALQHRVPRTYFVSRWSYDVSFYNNLVPLAYHYANKMDIRHVGNHLPVHYVQGRRFRVYAIPVPSCAGPASSGISWWTNEIATSAKLELGMTSAEFDDKQSCIEIFLQPSTPNHPVSMTKCKLHATSLLRCCHSCMGR